jgi:biopolymer transport protein ExbD
MIGSTVFQIQKKKTPAPQLMLVSLVDIFTFFIFFLLLNAGESPKIENAHYVALPNSTSSTIPSHKLLIFIGGETVWIGDKAIADVKEILKAPEKQIESLSAELLSLKEKKGELTDEEKENGLSITIMGDKSVTYTVLKSVMATCQGSDYRNISLAVNQVLPSSLQAKNPTVAQNSSTKVGG